MRMRALWLMLMLAPAPAFSEGAVQTFDCVTSALCDEDGACAPLGDTLVHPVTFRVEPVSVGPEGAGEYRINYLDISASMTNVTGRGPLLWSEGNGDRQVVLFTSETNLLWQSFDSASARSVVSFLTCEMTR